jgi:hypothetical protein
MGNESVGIAPGGTLAASVSGDAVMQSRTTRRKASRGDTGVPSGVVASRQANRRSRQHRPVASDSM